MCQLLSVLAEVKPFLSRAARGPLIIALVGVIVDERRRPVKPLFELADCGSLDDYIKRGWEAAAAGGCCAGWRERRGGWVGTHAAVTGCSRCCAAVATASKRTCVCVHQV